MKNGQKPQIGFAGIGRIGHRRLKGILESGNVEVAAIFDPDQDNLQKVLQEPGMKEAGLDRTKLVPDFDSLVELGLDGVVISSPNRMHAEQSIQALEGDTAVFCQKPLGCDREEVDEVVDTARRVDRLLGVDLTYRRSPAMKEIHRRMQAGEIGDVFAADLVFHNAYGPDKTWFYDRRQSGGGCFLDLGIHMVDLALWTLDFPRVEEVHSRFYTNGRPHNGADQETVEDYALARLDLDSGATVQIGCSWHLSAGQNAVIRATFHGTKGSLHMYNQGGSYFDLVAEKHTGTQRETLVLPNGRWDSGMAIDWTDRLSRTNRFAPEAVRYGETAHVLDEVYGK